MSFLDFNRGDCYQKLGKKINEIVDKAEGHIVFLDEDLNFQYDVQHGPEKATGPIINRIIHLEALMSFTRNQDSRRVVRIKNLLGEAFVRSHHDGDNKSATQALDDAETLIQSWNNDVSSKWYFCSAIITAGAFVVLMVLIVAFRSFLTSDLGSTFVLITTVGFLGSLGAFASICIRHRQLALDANMGLTVHVIEASARIFIGVVAGIIMILLAKGGMILSVVDKAENPNYIFYALGVLCGASERILPNFINQAEHVVAGGGFHAAQEENTHEKSGKAAQDRVR